MATAEDSGDDAGLPGSVGSAKEFVREKLRDADSPKAPVEMAREYGCSPGHMQDTCRELLDEGRIERVETGLYASAPGGMADPGEGETGPGQGAQQGDEAAATAGPEDGEESDPSADGGPRSEGHDTEDGDGPSDRDAAIAGGVTAGAAAVPAALERMDTRQMVLLLAAAVAVYLLFVRDGSGSSSGATDADQEESGDDFQVADGGVMG